MIMQDVPEIPIYFYGVARVVSPQIINLPYDEMGAPHFAEMGRRSVSAPHCKLT